MLDLGQHALYIIASYVGAAFVVIALIVDTLWRAKQQTKKLKTLEEAGIRRRSWETPQ